MQEDTYDMTKDWWYMSDSVCDIKEWNRIADLKPQQFSTLVSFKIRASVPLPRTINAECVQQGCMAGRPGTSTSHDVVVAQYFSQKRWDKMPSSMLEVRDDRRGARLAALSVPTHTSTIRAGRRAGPQGDNALLTPEERRQINEYETKMQSAMRLGRKAQHQKTRQEETSRIMYTSRFFFLRSCICMHYQDRARGTTPSVTRGKYTAEPAC